MCHLLALNAALSGAWLGFECQSQKSLREELSEHFAVAETEAEIAHPEAAHLQRDRICAEMLFTWLLVIISILHPNSMIF